MSRTVTSANVAIFALQQKKEPIFVAAMTTSKSGHFSLFHEPKSNLNKIGYRADIENSDGKPVSLYFPFVEHSAYQLEVDKQFGGTLESIAFAVNCYIPAIFQPQEEIGRGKDIYDIQGSDSEFNAVPGLVSLTYQAVVRMFSEDVDYDVLSEGSHCREDHNGPFEVKVDEEDVVRLVCLLAGNYDALAHCRLGDISSEQWEIFCTTADKILEIQERLTGESTYFERQVA